MSRLCQNKISAKAVNSGYRGCESLVVKQPWSWCHQNGITSNHCAPASYVTGPDGSRHYIETHAKDVNNCDLYFDPFTMEKCGGGTEGSTGNALDRGERAINKGEIPGTCYELNDSASQCDVPADLINDSYINQAINRDVALEYLENSWKLNCGGRLPGSCSSRITQEACENTFSTDTNTGYEHCIWHNQSCVPSSTTRDPSRVNLEDPATCVAIGNAEWAPYISENPDAAALDPRNMIDFDFGTPDDPGEMGFNNNDRCNLGHLKDILNHDCPQFSFLTEMTPANVNDAVVSLGDARATLCTPGCYQNFMLDWFNNCYSDDEKKNAIKDEMIKKIAKRNHPVSYDSALDVALVQKSFLESLPNRYCTSHPTFPPGSPEYRNLNTTDRDKQTACNFYNMGEAFRQSCPEFINSDDTIRIPSSPNECGRNCNNFRRQWWTDCAGMDGNDGGDIQDDSIWGGILNEMQQIGIYQTDPNRDPATDLENIRRVVSTCERGH